MHKHWNSMIDRRGFLRFGALAGALCATGCDGGSEPTKVTTPPTPTGNRKRLEMLEAKGAEATAKAAKKK
jgi:hypothetical protein